MATYTSFAELNGKTLAYDDDVIFKVSTRILRYKVASNHLRINGRIDNSLIFSRLKIKHKYSFCDKFYGYPSGRDGLFPESNGYDFEALTRVTLALFCLIEDGTCEGLIFKDEKGNWKETKLPIIRKLTDIYNIMLTKGTWTVGCQIIPIKKVKELINLHQEEFGNLL